MGLLQIPRSSSVLRPAEWLQVTSQEGVAHRWHHGGFSTTIEGPADITSVPRRRAESRKIVLRWHAASKDIYIDVPDAHLPEIPHDHQYQLWAIVDGKAIDAGVFDLESGGEALHKLKRIERAQAFAVTVEPRGGSPAPTLEKMLVHGEVVGA